MIQVHVYSVSTWRIKYTANFETLDDARTFAAQINSNNHLFARTYVNWSEIHSMQNL